MADKSSATRVETEFKAQIIDRLYDVALDPIRLEELLDLWEDSVADLRAEAGKGPVTIDDPDLDAHIRRATIFLDRYETAHPQEGFDSILEHIPRSAAFVADGGPDITAFNRAAALAFRLGDGAAMADLPFDDADIATLRSVIRRVAPGLDAKVVTLRIRSSVTGSPVIVRVSPVESDHHDPQALVLSTELVWPEGFDATVGEAFGLTEAETAIVHGITMGLPVRDIAKARRRSPETVRTQLRSILAKTETHSQSELVRVVLGLMDVALIRAAPAERTFGAASPGDVVHGGETLDPLTVHRLRLADGRRLDWIEFGDPEGAPCLYMHLALGLTRWPRSAERAAKSDGIRVIVPHRAGYGQTDLPPKCADHLTTVTLDYAAVCDHLGLSRCAVLALGADLRFAMNLAILRPDLVVGIVGCAAQLPVRTPAQYKRMDKWQRFILANARYAPKVLPFLVKAGFVVARRIGKEAFFKQCNGGSPADMAALADPEIRAALLAGSEVTLGPQRSAHEGFTLECIGSERDWSAIVHACRVPVELLQGDQDPQTPAQTMHELMADYPRLEVEFLPGNGQLLFFNEWRKALGRLSRFLRK